jgi:dienelactone hydrolase
MKRIASRILPMVSCIKLLFIPLFLLTPMPLSADIALVHAGRIDLDGRALPTAPNPTLPREGKPPGILNVSQPNLQLHRTPLSPAKGTILLFPGGGYRGLAIVHEGLNVADFLNGLGYDVAILEYSIGKDDVTVRPQALSDATKALDLVYLHGKEYGLSTDSLGVIGFSAGGHLATRLVHEKGKDVLFSDIILIYPAYLDAPGGLKTEITIPRGISPSSRFFVLIGDKDLPERVTSSQGYSEAAKAAGLESELHLLPGIPHGFGLQPGQRGVVGSWPALLEAFLKKSDSSKSGGKGSS